VQKRSVLKWTDEQFERLKLAADKLGLSVPAYVKLRALESIG